jgi:hypothetical protein
MRQKTTGEVPHTQLVVSNVGVTRGGHLWSLIWFEIEQTVVTVGYCLVFRVCCVLSIRSGDSSAYPSALSFSGQNVTGSGIRHRRGVGGVSSNSQNLRAYRCNRYLAATAKFYNISSVSGLMRTSLSSTKHGRILCACGLSAPSSSGRLFTDARVSRGVY